MRFTSDSRTPGAKPTQKPISRGFRPDVNGVSAQRLSHGKLRAASFSLRDVQIEAGRDTP